VLTTGQAEGGTMSVQATSEGTPSLFVIHGPGELRQRAGPSLGVSDWVTLESTQKARAA